MRDSSESDFGMMPLSTSFRRDSTRPLRLPFGLGSCYLVQGADLADVVEEKILMGNAT